MKKKTSITTYVLLTITAIVFFVLSFTNFCYSLPLWLNIATLGSCYGVQFLIQLLSRILLLVMVIIIGVKIYGNTKK